MKEGIVIAPLKKLDFTLFCPVPTRLESIGIAPLQSRCTFEMRRKKKSISEEYLKIETLGGCTDTKLI